MHLTIPTSFYLPMWGMLVVYSSVTMQCASIRDIRSMSRPGYSVFSFGSLIFCFAIINIQCEEFMLTAQDKSEGVTLFIKNGTENAILHTLENRTLSQEKGANMAIDYIGNSHAIIFVALHGGIGVIEVKMNNSSLKVTRTKFVYLNPCMPGLIYKRDGSIFTICFNFYSWLNATALCLAKLVLHRNFDVLFIVKFELLFYGTRINLTNFIQFEYNKIVYGIGRTLYAVIPRTTAITNKKTNLFLTLRREIRYLGLSWRCTKNFMCLNKTDNEIFAFCEDRWLRFSLNEMQWIFEPPIVMFI